MLKARQQLDKYRIEGRLAEGGYATVYRAYDTIEGVRVALKVPHARFVTDETLEDFRVEVRLTASLDHPNILPIKTAGFIGDMFVIVYPMGQGTLADRLRRRYSSRAALQQAGQLLEAVAYAHSCRVIHCDIKPENVILFPNGRVRLTDFGIAKLALQTRSLTGSGTGTIGYLAPEQAFGRPSFRSDVFACGLLLHRMFSGQLPEWPFNWPPPGIDRLRRNVSPGFVALIRRATEIDEGKRYRDGQHLLEAFRRAKPRALRGQSGKRGRKAKRVSSDWRTALQREFRRTHGKALALRCTCSRCHGPVSEWMLSCPWCRASHKRYRGPTSFPARCKRCGRGVKRDWPFCAWCYGGRIQEVSSREYPDVRYSARCNNPTCSRKELMPFMRYCPWCRTKVRRRWKIEGVSAKCAGCEWGVVPEYWTACPWCGRRI